jgi:hypothetical protein
MFGSPTTVSCDKVPCAVGSTNTIIVKLIMTKGVHINTEAPNSYNAKTTNYSIVQIVDEKKTSLTKESEDIVVKFTKLFEGEAKVQIETALFVCNDSGMCTKKDLILEFDVVDGEACDVVKVHKFHVDF